MDSTEKFWVAIWAMVIAGALGLVTVVAANRIDTKKTIARMVKDGADPLAAACAVDGAHGAGDAAICALVAARIAERKAP